MNGGLATANQVRDREKGLNKSFWKWRALYKIFSQAISPVSVAPENLGVRVRSKHTPYMWVTLQDFFTHSIIKRKQRISYFFKFILFIDFLRNLALK
jgi:hypothetical protein